MLCIILFASGNWQNLLTFNSVGGHLGQHYTTWDFLRKHSFLNTTVLIKQTALTKHLGIFRLVFRELEILALCGTKDKSSFLFTKKTDRGSVSLTFAGWSPTDRSPNSLPWTEQNFKQSSQSCTYCEVGSIMCWALGPNFTTLLHYTRRESIPLFHPSF